MARPFGSGPRPLPMKYWFVSFALFKKNMETNFGNTVIETNSPFFEITATSKHIQKKLTGGNIVILSFQEVSRETFKEHKGD